MGVRLRQVPYGAWGTTGAYNHISRTSNMGFDAKQQDQKCGSDDSDQRRDCQQTLSLTLKKLATSLMCGVNTPPGPVILGEPLRSTSMATLP